MWISLGHERGRRPRRRWSGLALAAALGFLGLALPGGALAQDPAFQFLAPEKADRPEGRKWSASARVGSSITSGNAYGLSFTGGGAAALRERDDQIAADFSAAYVRTRLQVATDANGVAGIGPGEVREIVQTTSAAWAGRLRYDRFLGTHDSLYGTASAAGDRPAGRSLVAGFQVGVSRALIRSERQSLAVEVGYDFAFQEYVASTESVTLHSARLFAGYSFVPSPGASLSLSAEWLTNVSGTGTPTGHVSPLEDNRLASAAQLGVKLNEHGELAVRLRARYDSRPAPRPPPSGTSFEAGYVPLADRLDTQTELLFIYRFL